MFSRIKYQKKSVYLKFIFINIQGEIELLQEKEIDSMAKKGKGHSLFSPSQNSRFWTTCTLPLQYTNATNLDETDSAFKS